MDTWSQRCNDAGFEDGEWGPWAKESRQPPEAGKREEINSSPEPPEKKCSSAEILIFLPSDTRVRYLIYRTVKYENCVVLSH